MIYNTIHHEIRNNAKLSLIDWCLLESIYHLSRSEKSKYKNWCNASKSNFTYLASTRTIATRYKHLEKEGWIEFKDEKRFLKRTTKKYFNEVQSYVLGMKKLHQEYEETSPTSMKKLHPTYEETSPNNKKYNNIDNNKREREKENTPTRKKIENEILLSNEIENLNKKLAKLKKQEKDLIKEIKTPPSSDMWTRLQTTLHNYKMPFSVSLNKHLLKYWKYLEEKKGHNWGTKTTVLLQVDMVTKFLKKYSEKEIIDSLQECQERGNITYNPQWTKNRKQKTKEIQNTYKPTQNDDGTPIYMMGLQ